MSTSDASRVDAAPVRQRRNDSLLDLRFGSRSCGNQERGEAGFVGDDFAVTQRAIETPFPTGRLVGRRISHRQRACLVASPTAYETQAEEFIVERDATRERSRVLGATVSEDESRGPVDHKCE